MYEKHVDRSTFPGIFGTISSERMIWPIALEQFLKHHSFIYAFIVFKLTTACWPVCFISIFFPNSSFSQTCTVNHSLRKNSHEKIEFLLVIILLFAYLNEVCVDLFFRSNAFSLENNANFALQRIDASYPFGSDANEPANHHRSFQ